jgi:hypothetical protein
LVADTVVITKTSADIMTKHNKSLSDVSYTIHDASKSDDDDDDDDESVDASVLRPVMMHKLISKQMQQNVKNVRSNSCKDEMRKESVN